MRMGAWDPVNYSEAGINIRRFGSYVHGRKMTEDTVDIAITKFPLARCPDGGYLCLGGRHRFRAVG